MNGSVTTLRVNSRMGSLPATAPHELGAFGVHPSSTRPLQLSSALLPQISLMVDRKGVHVAAAGDEQEFAPLHEPAHVHWPRPMVQPSSMQPS